MSIALIKKLSLAQLLPGWLIRALGFIKEVVMAFDIFRSLHEDSILLAMNLSVSGGVILDYTQRGTHDTLVIIAHEFEVEQYGALRLATNIARQVFNPESHRTIFCIVCWGAEVRPGQLASLGQALANETSVTVRAATDTVYGVFERPFELSTRGAWVDIHPQDSVAAITDYLKDLHL